MVLRCFKEGCSNTFAYDSSTRFVLITLFDTSFVALVCFVIL